MLALALASRNLNNTLIDREKLYNIKNEKNKNIKSLNIFKIKIS